MAWNCQSNLGGCIVVWIGDTLTGEWVPPLKIAHAATADARSSIHSYNRKCVVCSYEVMLFKYTWGLDLILKSTESLSAIIKFEFVQIVGLCVLVCVSLSFETFGNWNADARETVVGTWHLDSDSRIWFISRFGIPLKATHTDSDSVCFSNRIIVTFLGKKRFSFMWLRMK